MAVKKIFEAEGYRQVCICKDLPGKDRVVKARWEGQAGTGVQEE